jgi:hypothetical protein
MNYSKPQVLAQNKASGSFAAGCPANGFGHEVTCKKCERTK